MALKFSVSTLKREAYFMEYAEQAWPVAKLPLMITGGFRSRAMMETAVTSGNVDVIGLARPFCASTDFCGQLLRGEIGEVPKVEERLLLNRASHAAITDDREFNLLESNHQLAWMYLQLVRFGDGLDADWNMPLETAAPMFEKSESDREQARLRALSAAQA